MTASISYINLSWAVVGIIDKDVRNGLQSMKRPDEPIEVTIERYVIGYLVFWHIAFIDKEKMNRCNDEKVIELGRKKMEEYIFSHPPIATLPKFYIVFLNQPQIGCDTHGLSDVFCVSPISVFDSPLTESWRISFSRSERISSGCFLHRLPSNE